jgi:5'-methylthioadenosine phosphorylase
VLQIDLALIGGTGIGDRLAQLGGTPIAQPTPFGLLRGQLITHNNAKILLIQRHALGHKNPPHKINYKAIAAGTRTLGAKLCLASAAVGSVRPDWKVGTLAICTDLLDLSSRNVTLFDHGVQHTDMTEPFPAAPQLLALAAKRAIVVHEATYVTTAGPRYETPAEIKAIRTLGGDLVGMTASSEAVAMREAGVPYGCIAIITNLAAGLAQHLSHTEVVEVMQHAGQTVVDLMLDAAELTNP